MAKIALLTALLAAVVPSLAAPAAEPDTTSNNVVRIPIKRNALPNLEGRDVSVALENYKIGYSIDLAIGTPAQPIQLTIDTGSSEIWAFAATGCNQCRGGTYNPSKSTTVQAVSNLGPFSQVYGDTSSASGYYVTDKVALGGASISNVVLGVATKTVRFQNDRGVMGIGFDTAHTSTQQYPGIVQKMYDQKLISSRSYSIYLNDIGDSTGSIIFGGIDHTKYTGKLTYLPIIKRVAGDRVDRLQVQWTSLSITNSTGASVKLTNPVLSYPVLLDTGSTATYLPPTIYWAIYSYFDAYTPVAGGDAYVPCNLPKGYFTWGFGSGPAVTIQVPFSEIAVPTTSGKCLFGFAPLAGPVMILGDTFLRSAYVNYDFDRNLIGMAQSKN